MAISEGTRDVLLLAANNRCQCLGMYGCEPPHTRCNRIGSLLVPLEIDHIRPLFAGGTDDIGNLQVLCYQCHKNKTARDRVIYAHLLP